MTEAETFRGKNSFKLKRRWTGREERGADDARPHLFIVDGQDDLYECRFKRLFYLVDVFYVNRNGDRFVGVGL